MTIRLLIDECLSPKLVTVAHEAGYECTCSRDRCLLGSRDWQLVDYVIAGDFIFVTNNAVDFRGSGVISPGGLNAHREIHPGLICLCSPFQMTLPKQCSMFNRALKELSALPDLINQALEMWEDTGGAIGSVLYAIPRS